MANLLDYKKSNFSPAFLFLPQREREALKTIYSFCREVDDVVDGERSREEASRVLELWVSFIDGRGLSPREELGQRLARVVSRYNIPRVHLLEIIDGVKTDLLRSRYETFEPLKKYCYGVASAVGLCCLPIFGVPVSEARDYAVNLGLAFQLTNIIRDVATDASRGRIYIPLEDLSRFGYTERDLMSKTSNPKFVALMEFQAGRARGFYRLAAQSLPLAWNRPLLPARVMAAVYEGLLTKIEKSGFRVFEEKVSLNPVSKWSIVARTLFS